MDNEAIFTDKVFVKPLPSAPLNQRKIETITKMTEKT